MLYADPDSIPNFDDVAEKAGTDDTFSDNMFRISDDLKATYTKNVTDMFIDLDRLGYIWESKICSNHLNLVLMRLQSERQAVSSLIIVITVIFHCKRNKLTFHYEWKVQMSL